MKRALVLLFVLGCREDVQLRPGMSTGDGSPTDATASMDAIDARVMCDANPSVCDVDHPCCGQRCAITPPSTTPMCMGSCFADGMQCTDSQQCCGLDCNGGICRPPNNCFAFGHTCSGDADCCCGICSGGTCMTGYRTPGQACPPGEDWHCSTGLCQNGICALNMFCKALSLACTTNGECCLGYCFMGRCENASCTPSG